MRPLSQVDPWNGCKACRRQADLGIMPCHNWTHELQTWWNNGRAPARMYGTDPKHEPPEPPAIGTSSTALGLAGIALASLAGKLWKEEAADAR